MRVVVVTPPEPVVTIDEAKAHLNVEHGEHDAVITGMVAAATAHLDGPAGWLGRALGLQTLEARFDAWCDVRLPYPPAIDLTEVVTFGSASAVILPPDSYRLIDDRIYAADGSQLPNLPPAWGPPRIRVRYRAGYVVDPDADPIVPALPSPIRAAILLMVGDLYANRQTTAASPSVRIDMSTTVENLLTPFRVFA